MSAKLTVAVVSILAVGCGDNLEGSRVSPDRGDGGVAICNPVTQQGCLPGEKCALVGDVGVSPVATCIPNGTISPGGECESGNETGEPDDCRSEPGQGYSCPTGKCVPFCDPTVEDKCAEGTCVGFDSTGLPIGVVVGICLPPCDPVAQDCGADLGCYLRVAGDDTEGLCAPVPPPSSGHTQDVQCHGPTSSTCFLNGCEAGFQPLGPLEPNTFGTAVCRKWCTPTRTDIDHIDHPEGIEDPEQGMTSCASPDSALVPGPDSSPNDRYQCRYLNSFFDDTRDLPDSLGFCVDKLVWGDCTEFDIEACFVEGDEAACENITFGCLSQSDIDGLFESDPLLPPKPPLLPPQP